VRGVSLVTSSFDALKWCDVEGSRVTRRGIRALESWAGAGTDM